MPFENKDIMTAQLNNIKQRAIEFPLITPTDAVGFLGNITTKNPSEFILREKEKLQLFAFNFGDSESIEVPLFQFNPVNNAVYNVVPKLCRILNGLNDFGVYIWFTTVSDDLKCTPAEAIKNPELEDDLIFLAGLFYSNSQLSDLDFTVEKNNLS